MSNEYEIDAVRAARRHATGQDHPGVPTAITNATVPNAATAYFGHRSPPSGDARSYPTACRRRPRDICAGRAPTTAGGTRSPLKRRQAYPPRSIMAGQICHARTDYRRQRQRRAWPVGSRLVFVRGRPYPRRIESPTYQQRWRHLTDKQKRRRPRERGRRATVCHRATQSG